MVALAALYLNARDLKSACNAQTTVKTPQPNQALQPTAPPRHVFDVDLS